MYDHLREHSGKALFMLYKAIKHQTEKGPVDIITSDARYALTEYRLLQQKIESRVLVSTWLAVFLFLIYILKKFNKSESFFAELRWD